MRHYVIPAVDCMNIYYTWRDGGPTCFRTATPIRKETYTKMQIVRVNLVTCSYIYGRLQMPNNVFHSAGPALGPLDGPGIDS